MADAKLFTLLKVAVPVLLLVVIFGTGLAVAITVGVTKAKLEQCLFTSDITCNVSQKNGVPWRQYTFSPQSSAPCNYCLTIQIVAILVSPVLGIYWIIVNMSSRLQKLIFRLIVLGVEALFTVLTLATAGVITAGLNKFCDQLVEDVCPKKPAKECKTFESWINWDKSNGDRLIDGSSFYSMTESGEGAAWVSFLFWTLLTLWSGAISFLEMRSRRTSKRSSGPSTPTAVAI